MNDDEELYREMDEDDDSTWAIVKKKSKKKLNLTIMSKTEAVAWRRQCF